MWSDLTYSLLLVAVRSIHAGEPVLCAFLSTCGLPWLLGVEEVLVSVVYDRLLLLVALVLRHWVLVVLGSGWFGTGNSAATSLRSILLLGLGLEILGDRSEGVIVSLLPPLLVVEATSASSVESTSVFAESTSVPLEASAVFVAATTSSSSSSVGASVLVLHVIEEALGSFVALLLRPVSVSVQVSVWISEVVAVLWSSLEASVKVVVVIPSSSASPLSSVASSAAVLSTTVVEVTSIVPVTSSSASASTLWLSLLEGGVRERIKEIVLCVVLWLLFALFALLLGFAFELLLWHLKSIWSVFALHFLVWHGCYHAFLSFLSFSCRVTIFGFL